MKNNKDLFEGIVIISSIIIVFFGMMIITGKMTGNDWLASFPEISWNNLITKEALMDLIDF
ncbi:hypothetical protein [Bacillus sp. Marseille-Q3570]|uniref:hypothetical protein n=1 Tax=Bacillus sp. Marseille-Q3570 TaxID=2963522 RepID=UPI0021B735A8|nr:hypothetical protein [Bacillus sp. Marseille-Q3570]